MHPLLLDFLPIPLVTLEAAVILLKPEVTILGWVASKRDKRGSCYPHAW